MRQTSDLKDDLEQLVKDLGAYTMQVAASKGFESAIPGCRPRDILKDCNSVVAFGVYVGLDYYRSIQLENKRIGESRVMHIFRDWMEYKIFEFLRERGYHASVPTGLFDRKRLIHRFSFKLAAYEAGLGVYGRCGIIITPEYGPRVNFGAVLTDAKLEPNEKLTNFNPCQDCELCASSCPPKAINTSLDPPKSHNRDVCLDFIQKLRESTDDARFLCGYCYKNCPLGKVHKPGFELSRYRSLLDLSIHERKQLISVCVK